MSKPRAKPRPPERDYSHRTLLDKLGVKLGQRILVLDIDDPNFANEIAAFKPTFAQSESSEQFDLILFGVEEEKALRRLTALRKTILSNGGIWVIYPKGRPELIRETDVIGAAKSAGLVDNKICRFSDTHTAMRCVIPLANRK